MHLYIIKRTRMYSTYFHNAFEYEQTISYEGLSRFTKCHDIIIWNKMTLSLNIGSLKSNVSSMVGTIDEFEFQPMISKQLKSMPNR